ncbi:MAG: hypothetical protein LBE92_20945 [Chryseobacterium sp.]|jgi:hypothetical protein|uniref:hypothetical protein n=1 Tax=Chryseobacterium sp. TaxID=1871047 RepID=UPI002838C14E|nr:hypothetical protein [Chryseobacterium sp.]MDR2238605.1 hypothetical protein [Chryseobacterium sp.]
MKNNYLNSEEAREIMKEISEKLQPLLMEGREYYSEITKTDFGSTGGSVSFYENGILYGYSSDNPDEISKHLDEVEEIRLSSLVSFFPVYSKVKFTFKKGEPVVAEQYTVAMYLEGFKNKIENNSSRSEKTIKKELLVRFKQEADELGMFIDSTEYYDDATMRSFDFMRNSDDLKSIYHLVGGLESFYFKYENGKIEAQSVPALEEYGLSLLTIENIEVEQEYKKRQEAFEEGVKLRHDFFRSLGTLDDRVIYLRVGGFRDHSWPEGSTSHNSCKMRVIHTPETTILVTDGLTDIYTSPRFDQNLEYNGIGAEFYMEFYGAIPFGVMHEHFAMALINTTSQIALGHGDIKKLMLSQQYVSVEFTEEDVELWVNRENKANHNLNSFLTPEKFLKDDSFGVILGMESKLVPQKVPFNLEEILMISIKPVEGKWLKRTKLRSKDNDMVKAAKEEIIESWQTSGEMNLVPLTYQKEYIQTSPESGGTQLACLFPF